MDLGIAEKTAVVTGASVGIGRGIALALGAEGARLALSARRRHLLEEVAVEIVKLVTYAQKSKRFAVFLHLPPQLGGN